jgi:hypothetical protein
MSGSTFGGLPPYVLNNVYEFGINGALAMVQTQQRGADSANALSYYSSIIEALQAIAGGAVPVVPPFASPSTTIAYCYGNATAPPLAVKATISNWAYATQFVHRLHAVGLVTTLYGVATLPPIRVLH